MSEERPSRIVVGVGNPGSRYAGTRHNLGFAAVEEAVRQMGLRLSRPFGSARKVGKSRWVLGFGPAGPFLIMQPLTFVNLTGAAVAAAVSWSGLGPGSIFVVCDDLNLALGSIRVRARGSAGGHNGLRSIESALGTQDYPRLRMGIGSSEECDVVDHVLGRFSSEEEPVVASVLQRAAEVIQGFLRGSSLEELMNRYNIR